MKKIIVTIALFVCIFSVASNADAQIKIDYASTTVDTTGIDRGQEEAEKYTKDIKAHTPEEEKVPSKEIGFWTALFYIFVFILGTFFAR